MSFTEYRTIDLDIDGANDYIPPVIASSGDNHGRRLRVTLKKHGDIIPPTDTMSARLMFDSKPSDASWFGDAVDMEKTATGFEVDFPALPLRSEAQSIPMSVAVTDTQTIGEVDAATTTSNTICSRDFIVKLQRGGVKSMGADGGAGLLADAIKRAEDAADAAGGAVTDVETAKKAAETATTQAANAANSATEAADSATAAQGSADNAAASATAAAKSASDAAASAEAAANSATEAANSATEAANYVTEAEQQVTAATEQATNAKTSADAAADSAQAARDTIDGFNLVTGTTTTTEPGGNATVDITRNGDVFTADFGIPRGDTGPHGYNHRLAEGDILSGATVPIARIHPNTDIIVGDTVIDGNGDAYLITAVTAENVTVGNAIPDFSLKGPTGQIENLNVATPITGDGSTTPLSVAPATADAVGVVKPGTGLTVTPDGTLNAAEQYTLPTASATTLGGVKVGANLSIDGDGILSADAQELTPATTTALGGVIVGDGLNVATNGTISTTPYTLPTATADTLGGVKIGAGITAAADGTISAASAAKSVTVSFAPDDFTQDDSGLWNATKPVTGLGSLNLVTPVAGWDNVQAYAAASPVIVDHEDDTTVAEGSIKATCQAAPATAFNVRLIIIAE